MGNEAVFKLRVQIDEFQDRAVVVGKWEHLTDQELKREITCGRLQVRLQGKLLLGIASDINTFNRSKR